MQFIINSNPVKTFELTSKEAFKLLADTYNFNGCKIGDKKEQDAEGIKEYVHLQQQNKTALYFQTRTFKGLPFPVQFTGELVDDGIYNKFKLTKISLNPNTDFAKTCLLLLSLRASDTSVASNLLNKTLPYSMVIASTLGLNKVVDPELTGIIPEILQTPAAFLLSALGFSVAGDKARSYFKRSNLEAYKAKDADAVADLSDNQVQAFSDGVEAQKNYLSYFKSFATLKDYLHGNAFYAGMAAAENNEPDLIRKISARKFSA